jgi:DNA mismatch repair ATPase MutL
LLNEAGFYYSIIDRKLLKLQRCPVYNERKLGMEYFDIIVTEKKELQRVPKFTSMCAMMACREATKVG